MIKTASWTKSSGRKEKKTDVDGVNLDVTKNRACGQNIKTVKIRGLAQRSKKRPWIWKKELLTPDFRLTPGGSRPTGSCQKGKIMVPKRFRLETKIAHRTGGKKRHFTLRKANRKRRKITLTNKNPGLV